MGVGEDPARDHLMARARKRTRRWPSAVVFDLDGTLVDSAPDILSALNHGMAVAGRPPVAAANASCTVLGISPVFMTR